MTESPPESPLFSLWTNKAADSNQSPRPDEWGALKARALPNCAGVRLGELWGRSVRQPVPISRVVIGREAPPRGLQLRDDPNGRPRLDLT
jgi:hypothetical protein